jgi:hypothetical protein
LHQAGDAEAILLFEMSNPAHEKLAISLVGAMRRRIPSPAQLGTLRRAREALRFCKIPTQRPLQGEKTNDFAGMGVGTRPPSSRSRNATL